MIPGCARPAAAFYGGKRRKIRYKEVSSVHWQRGAGQHALRLLVIAPTPYRKSQSKKLYYRNPAYLLTTDLRNSPKVKSNVTEFLARAITWGRWAVTQINENSNSPTRRPARIWGSALQ